LLLEVTASIDFSTDEAATEKTGRGSGRFNEAIAYAITDLLAMAVVPWWKMPR
jgi:hypothetical protein